MPSARERPTAGPAVVQSLPTAAKAKKAARQADLVFAYAAGRYLVTGPVTSADDQGITQTVADCAVEIVLDVGEPELLVRRRARVRDVDARGGVGALPHLPVLAQGEAVTRRERVREDIVRERLHARRQQ